MQARLSQDVFEFDASPWGGAGLLLEGSEVKEFFCLTWKPIERMGIKIADPAFQTFWEFLTLALCLVQWAWLGDLLVCGDNTASLEMARSLKCSGKEVAIARELAWRMAKHDWKFAVAHLPKEANVVADSLSRVADPGFGFAGLPSTCEGAAEVSVCIDSFWQLPQDS